MSNPNEQWQYHADKVNCYTITRPDGTEVHFDPDPTTLDSAKELGELLEALVGAANEAPQQQQSERCGWCGSVDDCEHGLGKPSEQPESGEGGWHLPACKLPDGHKGHCVYDSIRLCSEVYETACTRPTGHEQPHGHLSWDIDHPTRHPGALEAKFRRVIEGIVMKTHSTVSPELLLENIREYAEAALKGADDA